MALTEHKTKTHHYFTDKQGRKQGEFRTWHTNGKPWEHYFYVDGKRHGEYKWWHTNGQLMEHFFFVDGHLQGEYKWWHTNGQPREHCFFVDNKQVIDFIEEPDEYPKKPEDKILFALKYGSGEWL